MVDRAEAVGYGTTFFETALAVSQANEIFQMIQIALAIISFVVTIAYTLWRWYKNATKEDSDGGKKITPKEVKDLTDDLKNIKKEEDDNDVNRN